MEARYYLYKFKDHLSLIHCHHFTGSSAPCCTICTIFTPFNLLLKAMLLKPYLKEQFRHQRVVDNRYSIKLVTLLESNPNINTFNEALSLDQRQIKVMQFILKVPPAKSGSTDILIQIKTTKKYI